MVTGSNFSDEDYILSEANQLGRPLDVYWMKPSFIRFLRISSLLIFSIGMVCLVLLISLTLKERDLQPDFFFLELLGSLYALILGGVMYGITVRQVQSMRVIVCEAGLLQVRKIIWRNHIEVVRWNEIQALKRDILRNYYLVRQGKEAFTFNSYQHIDRLIEFVRLRSGVA